MGCAVPCVDVNVYMYFSSSYFVVNPPHTQFKTKCLIIAPRVLGPVLFARTKILLNATYLFDLRHLYLNKLLQKSKATTKTLKSHSSLTTDRSFPLSSAFSA